jgi:hypothetical protein
MVAALYVEHGGSYYGLPGVDPWDDARDARAYAGPHPVVAHPPCQRWGKFWAGQPLHIKRTGERKVKGATTADASPRLLRPCADAAVFWSTRGGAMRGHTSG